ncbi:hypothetical protein GCM10011588_70480 [Nocardia jinanensis]|uniref:Uncharacterized protein n=2 Tax=Nocardia jinanensis TaxID=382504 RepID=A0A917RZT8_9NOCA|nr:hypothetical protein GCM10011588_70480 [Nocardia jinanensis]
MLAAVKSLQNPIDYIRTRAHGDLTTTADGVRGIVKAETGADADGARIAAAAARGGAERSPVDASAPLRGRTDAGEEITFSADRARTATMYDSDGNILGLRVLSTQPGVDDAVEGEYLRTWARSDRLADTEYSPAVRRQLPIRGAKTIWEWGHSRAAAWGAAVRRNGTPPIYVDAHAGLHGYGADVDIGTAENRVWKKVVVDGEAFGRIVGSHPDFHRAITTGPQRPVVVLSCNSSRPGATGAQEFATYMHGEGGVVSDIHVPTGIAKPEVLPGTDIAALALEQTTDEAGRLLPAVRTFHAPQ